MSLCGTGFVVKVKDSRVIKTAIEKCRKIAESYESNEGALRDIVFSGEEGRDAALVNPPGTLPTETLGCVGYVPPEASEWAGSEECADFVTVGIEACCAAINADLDIVWRVESEGEWFFFLGDEKEIAKRLIEREEANKAEELKGEVS